MKKNKRQCKKNTNLDLRHRHVNQRRTIEANTGCTTTTISSCGECTRYCMEKCEKVKTMPIALVGWHTETCKNCKHNPYVKYKIWED